MEIGDSKRKIVNQLERILGERPKQPGWQDDVITQRGGRYVIPVPSSQYRSDIGMLHDRSQSGSTYYIEPTQTVELNNKINLLFQEERLELDRILRALTAEISSRAQALQNNTILIGKLDAIYAAAAFGKQISAQRPVVVEESAFDLIKARHPLLIVQFKDIKKVVPTTISLGRQRQAVIVTGPNTGGKTIALKTIGLVALMAQSGLLVPVDEKSEVGIFREIFTDIGDEQSIELSLSTFSSHIKNIISATRNVSSTSLVLFDEIGAGTDPKEGSALAEAIITHMISCGARLVATTHYSQLKTLPLEHPELDNASLEFNRETLAPTYNLQLGIPGSSYAVEIASRLGMPSSICEQASSLLGVSERNLTELISSLEAELSQVRQDRSDLAARLEKATELENFYREQSSKLKKEIESKKEDALSETLSILDHTRKETERLVADIRKSQAGGDTVKQAHRKLRERTEQVKKARHKMHQKPKEREDYSKFEVGDAVRILSLNKEGEISELIGDKKARVRVGSMATTVELRNLEYLGRKDRQAPRKTPVGVNADSGMSPEINLVGMTVDEGQEQLDKFLYRAVVANLKQIYVIHGKGTGRLRKGLTEYLKGHPEVNSLRMGNWNEGGAGVTIVKLKT